MNYEKAKILLINLDYLNSSLLISQGKNWIEIKNLKNSKKFFHVKILLI